MADKIKISDSVTSSDSKIAASSKAVKDAYDTLTLELNKCVRKVNSQAPDTNGNVDVGGMPLGTLMPYTGKDVPAGFLRADGSTYTGMREAFPEFYEWVVQSGLTVPLASYALVEGSCGAYGLDQSAGTVRMPTLAAGVFGTTAAGQYGAAVGAGLPNITGSFAMGKAGYYSDGVLATEAFTVSKSASLRGNSATFQGNTGEFRLDASRSNPIYGASDTVRPPHVKYPWVIVVYSAAVPPSVAEAGEFVGLLDGKADRSSVEAIKAYIVETWRSGSLWFRKWSDGWIEQGGLIPGATMTTTDNITVSLNTPFTSKNFTALKNYGLNSSAINSLSARSASTWNHTTTSFDTYAHNLSAESVQFASWYACGY